MTHKRAVELLGTEIQSKGKRSEPGRKRLVNIEWVQKLPLKGLAFGTSVRQVLMVTTKADEKLYLQYPGRESAREGKKKRPYDFFPVFLDSSGSYGRDLGFTDVFGILHDALSPIKLKEEKQIRWLATLFYRMAFMLDHTIDQAPLMLEVRHLDYSKSGELQVGRVAKQAFPPCLRYSPSEDIIDEISAAVPSLGGMSLEGFLYYCDVLAWNEDAKYYYRNMQKEKPTWMGGTGRVNTLLTIMRVLGFVLGDVSFGDLLGRFLFGVSPATTEEVIAISGGLVTRKR